MDVRKQAPDEAYRSFKTLKVWNEMKASFSTSHLMFPHRQRGNSGRTIT